MTIDQIADIARLYGLHVDVFETVPAPYLVVRFDSDDGFHKQTFVLWQSGDWNVSSGNVDATYRHVFLLVDGWSRELQRSGR